jgi:micrococcal nuclease
MVFRNRVRPPLIVTASQTMILRCVLVSALLVPIIFGQQSFVGKVVGVSDGDTIRVMRGAAAVPVRLYGIDSPERRQAFYTQAKRNTSSLAFGKAVTVKIKTTDRWNRLVAEVLLQDGRNLNHEIVSAGYAWWFRQHAAKDRYLADLEAEARRHRRGLWSDADPVAPWEWRRQQRSTRKVAAGN